MKSIWFRTSMGMSLLTLLLVFNPPQALAGVSLSVSPTSISTNVDPGKTYQNNVLLTNNDKNPVKIHAFARAFQAKQDDKIDATVEFSDKIPLPPADRYKLTISPEYFTLDPNETREVAYNIRTGASAPGGGYYVGIVFETVPDTSSKAPIGQNIINQLNVPILTQVSGNLITSAEILSFTTEKPSYSHGPVKFQLRMKNTGNVHFPPIGRVDILADDGTKVDSIDIKGSNIIPNDTRTTTIEWTKRSLPPGKKKAVAHVYWGDQKYEQETTFEVLPESFGSVASSSFLWIGGLILLFFLLSSRRKSRKKPRRR